MGGVMFHVDGRTDGRTDRNEGTNNRISQFSRKRLKIESHSVHCHWLERRHIWHSWYKRKIFFQTLESSPNSCDFSIGIITQNNRIIGNKYARVFITRGKFSCRYVLPLDIEFPLLLFCKCTKICWKSQRHIIRNIHSRIAVAETSMSGSPPPAPRDLADTENVTPHQLRQEFSKINVGYKQLSLR